MVKKDPTTKISKTTPELISKHPDTLKLEVKELAPCCVKPPKTVWVTKNT